MKKKRFIALLCAGALALGMAGCEEKGESGGKKEIEVVTEPAFRELVDSAADQIMGFEDDLDITVTVFSTNAEKREREIQKLQTEIMAGKGPDVYILDTVIENESVSNTALFTNPYKTMQSGALAPLDEYMKEDSYWENSTYKKELLEAGQYEKRQYIIPFSCDYFVFCEPADGEQMTGTTVGEWIQQAESSQNQELWQAMQAISATAGRWFVPAVDYEAQEVLFSKDRWTELATVYISMLEQRNEEQWLENNPYEISNINHILGTENRQMKFIPDQDGKKLAAVRAYGAVSMSSSYKKEAYQFLMLFLNDTLEVEREKINMGTMVRGHVDPEGLPVQESAIRTKLENSASPELIDSICSTFSEIEGSYFVTQVEHNLYSAVGNLQSQIIGGEETDENQLRQEAAAAAEKAWKDYRTQMAE